LAPAKTLVETEGTMATIRDGIDEARGSHAPRFAPAGQSTQLIVGATPATDAVLLGTADRLYRAHHLRRVYYTAYSPIPAATAGLPTEAPPLVREHRLYQADWLMRHYGFDAGDWGTVLAALGAALADWRARRGEA
jgi:predicted DNA-binding helix-hairpin-helix protein